MPQRVGSCVILSFALVVLVSTILYRPEISASVGDTPITGTTPSEPLVEREDAIELPPRPTVGDPWNGRLRDEATDDTSRSNTPELPPVRLEKDSAIVPGPRPARRAFTTVRDGESLADVALRVYGVAGAGEQERLRQANRDLMAASDGPLPAGVPLRTP